MGGVVDALANAGKDVVESSGVKDEVSNMISHIRGRYAEFNKSEAGKDLFNLNTNYIQNFHKALQSGVDQATQLPKEMQPHPLQIHQQARNVASDVTFGKNHAAIAFLLKQAEKTPGMDDVARRMHVQNLADFTSAILHDTTSRPEFRDATAAEKMEAIKNEQPVPKKVVASQGSPFSLMKRNVTQNKETPVDMGMSKGGKLKLDPTYGKYGGKTEHLLHNFVSMQLAPFIVIQHVGTVLNTAISTPLHDLASGMADFISRGEGSEGKRIQDFAEKSGIFASTAYNNYAADFYGSHGLLAKYANDRVGQIFYKSTHYPLFDSARKLQLSYTAATGYHLATDMAERLVKNPTDKRAIYELNRIGIKPEDVIRQKGELRDDQIEKALWRYADSKVFLDSSLYRSQFSNSHWTVRMAGMFHSYTTRQAQLLKEEIFVKPWQTKGFTPAYFAQIAQSMAVLGGVFTMAGLITKNMTMLGRGDTEDINWSKDFADLSGRNGAKAMFWQAADDWSHLGAFGIMTNYMRGSGRYALAASMLGPLGNAVTGTAYDVGHPLYHKFVDGKELSDKAFHPAERDALEYTLPDNLGKILANQYLPTKRQEELEHPKTSMKFKLKTKKPHFKKFGS